MCSISIHINTDSKNFLESLLTMLGNNNVNGIYGKLLDQKISEMCRKGIRKAGFVNHNVEHKLKGHDSPT